MEKKKLIKLTLFIAGGALIGYVYFYFVGCKTGTCPISSNPYISTLYGAFTGLIMGFPTKKKFIEVPGNDKKE